ncbi:hypothetical protein DFS33DRAFT_778761 [Desarmillaria ectypa]|nr:hypothetical protein DFS33DRAFT_778761 [Desarmillaria ectypa]
MRTAALYLLYSKEERYCLCGPQANPASRLTLSHTNTHNNTQCSLPWEHYALALPNLGPRVTSCVRHRGNCDTQSGDFTILTFSKTYLFPYNFSSSLVSSGPLASLAAFPSQQPRWECTRVISLSNKRTKRPVTHILYLRIPNIYFFSYNSPLPPVLAQSAFVFPSQQPRFGVTASLPLHIPATDRPFQERIHTPKSAFNPRIPFVGSHFVCLVHNETIHTHAVY